MQAWFGVVFALAVILTAGLLRLSSGIWRVIWRALSAPRGNPRTRAQEFGLSAQAQK